LKAAQYWNFAQRPFYGPNTAKMRSLLLAFLPLACATSCPDRVLALSLSTDCYASYGVQLSTAEFQPNRLVAECSCHEGMHLFNKRFSIGQP
jgi:hypothetical protein